MVAGEISITEMAPSELGEALAAVRVCAPEEQQQMQMSMARMGQLTAVQAYRAEGGVELFDGLKRVRAARELSWPKLRVEVHALGAAGAKARLFRCNAGVGLSELEEAWLVRSLYREDQLDQPEIAMLLGRHKSWVCRRLVLAEGLSDEVTASVRLGVLSVTVARELGRLPRGNQEEVARAVARRGLTTRQAARLVNRLLAAPAAEWPALLEVVPEPAETVAKGGAPRRTPGEQLVADAWGMKRLAARLHARLLERSLQSLGEAACATVSRELVELRSVLAALGRTLDSRLAAPASRRTRAS